MRPPEITFHLFFAICLSAGKFTYEKGGSFLSIITVPKFKSKIQNSAAKPKLSIFLSQPIQSSLKAAQVSSQNIHKSLVSRRTMNH
jgi:hypothetical protein